MTRRHIIIEKLTRALVGLPAYQKLCLPWAMHRWLEEPPELRLSVYHSMLVGKFTFLDVPPGHKMADFERALANSKGLVSSIALDSSGIED